MSAFNEVFISEIIGKLVIDKVGNRVGRVTDVLVVQQESFPRVCGVEVKRTWETVLISDEHIAMLNKQIVSLNILRDNIQSAHCMGNDIFLKRNLLDRQIVDINGAKVVRINDLKIAQINQEYRLVAVDIGMRGLVRRLGIERPMKKIANWFHKRIPEKLISWDYVDLITTDLSLVKLSVSNRKLAELHPYDIAQIVSELSVNERSAIFESLDDETAAEALVEMEAEVQASILDGMSKDRVADILEIMSSDDATDVLNEMPDDKAEELLGLMEREEADDVKELREYEEHEAGSLMTTEFIALANTLTVDTTINKLRELAPDAETIYYIYVVDTEEHLTGVISLRELIIAKPDVILSDIMHTKVMAVQDDAPIEDVISMIRKYDLLAVPVLDSEGRIAGIITVDDVIDAVMPQRKKRLLKFA